MTCPRCGLPITEADGHHNLGRCFRAMAIDRDRWRKLYEELRRQTDPRCGPGDAEVRAWDTPEKS
jgi:hypothetical protein